jgi:ABC-type polysaccharide/polyol phosphate transport system ATPase subunit
VGDADFQKKSEQRMRELSEKSEAVIMVSHDLGLMRDMCQRVAWLDHGRLMAVGPAGEVVDQYLRAVG